MGEFTKIENYLINWFYIDHIELKITSPLDYYNIDKYVNITSKIWYKIDEKPQNLQYNKDKNAEKFLKRDIILTFLFRYYNFYF